VFRPTDLVISGPKQQCADFFSVLGSQTKDIKTSEPISKASKLFCGASPDSMSPASISISEKETVNSSNNDNTGHAYVFTTEGTSGVKEHDMVVDDKPILSQPLQKMSSY
jgi:hypothetical protein